MPDKKPDNENYYSCNLKSDKLYQVYQTQINRVKQYLNEEISFIRNELQGNEKVLELGAGYGRIMKELAPYIRLIVGIDNSQDTVEFGKKYLKNISNCELLFMDAHAVRMDRKFDVVICLQNGISAIKGDPLNLVNQGMKMLSPGGKAYFSSYSSDFWEDRLAWFQEQSDKGLLGKIDFAKTKKGIIVCQDGFIATTFSQEDMERLGQSVGYRYRVQEVDNSSIFLIIKKE